MKEGTPKFQLKLENQLIKASGTRPDKSNDLWRQTFVGKKYTGLNICLLSINFLTKGGHKYRNARPNNMASNMHYKTVQNVLNYFCAKMKADVTTMKNKYKHSISKT